MNDDQTYSEPEQFNQEFLRIFRHIQGLLQGLPF